MSFALVTSWPSRSIIRDPVLLGPAVVGAGLAAGWLGTDAGASGTRVATDIALAWALVAASLVALGRPRWRRARVLLAAAAFALLAADLQWASSHTLWTAGLVLEGLWVALLVQVVLTFPEGHAWSRSAWVTTAVVYAAVLGGQLVGAFVRPDSRDVLSIAPQQTISAGIDRAQDVVGIAAALAVAFLVTRRLLALYGPTRRAQAPLLIAAGLIAPAAALWLAWASAAATSTPMLQTIGRAVLLLVPLGVAGGIVWSGLARREASHLVVELGTEGSTGLRERLARVLGDPTLDVAYRLDDGRYVDAAGRPLELPQGTDRAITLVTAHGEEVAALVHDPALLDEPALVDSVRATAGLVLENERLAAEVRAQLAEVRASRVRLVAATDAERRRLERNLHDGAQQRLVTLSITLALAASREAAPSRGVLERAQDEVEETIVELREFARGVHPTLLREEGLDAAVEALARRTPLPVKVEGTVGGDRPPDAVELAAYFLVSEALTNVVKHASGTEATVRLQLRPGNIVVTVTDDGVGGARAAADSGLQGLRDRVEALDGTLVIESRPGRGTKVRAEIPCGS